MRAHPAGLGRFPIQSFTGASSSITVASARVAPKPRRINDIYRHLHVYLHNARRQYLAVADSQLGRPPLIIWVESFIRAITAAPSAPVRKRGWPYSKMRIGW